MHLSVTFKTDILLPTDGEGTVKKAEEKERAREKRGHGERTTRRLVEYSGKDQYRRKVAEGRWERYQERPAIDDRKKRTEEKIAGEDSSNRRQQKRAVEKRCLDRVG